VHVDSGVRLSFMLSFAARDITLPLASAADKSRRRVAERFKVMGCEDREVMDVEIPDKSLVSAD
jgi:hypothetical protein